MVSTSEGAVWILILQRFGDLPGKDVASEVPVDGGVHIDGLLQVQIPEAENEGALTSSACGRLQGKNAAGYLTITPGRRSKFLVTISSSSFSLFWEVP